MFRLKLVFVLLCFLGLQNICNGKYEIPDVILEAYKSKGFRASIPGDNETELFAFHGKLNEEILRTERGEFTGETKVSRDGLFTYYNPNLKLKQGDVVNYWVFVQHAQLGFRKDGLRWTVSELLPEPGAGCEVSITKLSDKVDVCKNMIVFEDNFDTVLDEKKWVLQQYMPAQPDYEFVLYKKDQDVTYINNNNLCIKPKLREDEKELLKMESIFTELGNGCTKPALCKNHTYLIKNPVVSGRIESKVSFSYGDFEIKARLPSGDWIYPEIYLEDEFSRRILIAYSRGNKHLTGNAGDDIGGTLLFGGPVFEPYEPVKSSKLSSYAQIAPFSASSHIYRLRWTEELIELFFDDQRYGAIETEPGFTGSNPSKFRLVLGVGVGGLNDFPDGYRSGTVVKPWINRKTTQVRDFFYNSSSWYPTWSEDGRQLQVDYVKFVDDMLMVYIVKNILNQ